MKTSSIIAIIVVVLVIIGAAYFIMGRNTASAPSAAAPQTPGQTATGTPVAKVLVLNTTTSPTLGVHLVATNGMTLYRYTKDAPNVSNCSGVCAANWPPFVVTSASGLAGGLNVQGQIGTLTRADGMLQVTYNGTPLYFWKNDKKAGDTTGQNFGGVWFVVKP